VGEWVGTPLFLVAEALVALVVKDYPMVCGLSALLWISDCAHLGISHKFARPD